MFTRLINNFGLPLIKHSKHPFCGSPLQTFCFCKKYPACAWMPRHFWKLWLKLRQRGLCVDKRLTKQCGLVVEHKTGNITNSSVAGSHGFVRYSTPGCVEKHKGKIWVHRPISQPSKNTTAMHLRFCVENWAALVTSSSQPMMQRTLRVGFKPVHWVWT